MGARAASERDCPIVGCRLFTGSIAFNVARQATIPNGRDRIANSECKSHA
jgi:hypothetical protein